MLPLIVTDSRNLGGQPHASFHGLRRLCTAGMCCATRTPRRHRIRYRRMCETVRTIHASCGSVPWRPSWLAEFAAKCPRRLRAKNSAVARQACAAAYQASRFLAVGGPSAHHCDVAGRYWREEDHRRRHVFQRYPLRPCQRRANPTGYECTSSLHRRRRQDNSEGPRMYWLSKTARRSGR